MRELLRIFRFYHFFNYEEVSRMENVCCYHVVMFVSILLSVSIVDVNVTVSGGRPVWCAVVASS